jgi:hypothetical protein
LCAFLCANERVLATGQHLIALKKVVESELWGVWASKPNPETTQLAHIFH